MNTRLKLAAFGSVMLVSAAAATIIAVQDDKGRIATDSHRATSLGFRSLGHRAFRELLRELGHPAIASRNASGARARSGTLLVVAEPHLWSGPETLEEIVSQSESTLLVLPKWRPPPDDGDAAPKVGLRGEINAGAALAELGIPAVVVRVTDPEWIPQKLGPAPTTVAPTQLLVDADDTFANRKLVRVVAAKEGILVARVQVGERELTILSDPDLIANHGLTLGGNAELAVGIVRDLVDEGAVVIFDETLHALYRPPSLIDAVTRFPLALALAQALLAAAALLWLAVPRFGQPVSDSGGIGAGKRALIDNVAQLQRTAGDAAHSSRQYLDHVMREVAAAQSVADQGEPARRIELLDALGRRRKTSDSVAELDRRIKALGGSRSRHVVADAVDLARRVRRWRKEILDGPGTSSSDG